MIGHNVHLAALLTRLFAFETQLGGLSASVQLVTAILAALTLSTVTAWFGLTGCVTGIGHLADLVAGFCSFKLCKVVQDLVNEHVLSVQVGLQQP
jgi:hypothetical protein